MKSLVLALICLFGVSAEARWEITASTTEKATTAAEAQSLRTKYANDLKYLSAADWYFISELTVLVDTWEWKGATTCPVGYPVPTLRDVTYSYSLNGPFGYFGQTVLGDLAVNNPHTPPCE